MYLCLCYAVSDKTVKDMLQKNASLTVKDIQEHHNAGKGCGSCLCDLKAFLKCKKEKLKKSLKENLSSEDLG